MEANMSGEVELQLKACRCGFDHKGFDCGELELVPEEVGGCSCGTKFYTEEELLEHECELDEEPVATLVPGRAGTVHAPRPGSEPLIFTRDDGGLNIHPPYPGPANCCDGRMVHIFVNRNGVSLCPSCDAERNPS